MTIPYSPRLTQALHLSKAAARRFGHAHVGPEQLLLGLLGLGEGSALRMLQQVGVTAPMLQPQLEGEPRGFGEPAPADAEGHPLGLDAEHLLYIAHREANFWQSERVETLHLLLALLRDEQSRVGRLFQSAGVEYQLVFDMAAYDRVGLRLATAA